MKATCSCLFSYFYIITTGNIFPRKNAKKSWGRTCQAEGIIF